MTQSHSYAWHFKRLMIFGIPLVLAQVLQMAIGVTDTMIVGRLGEIPLAQIGLGSTYTFVAIIFPMGFSIAASVLIANAYAKEDFARVKHLVQMALWQSVFFFLLAIPFMWKADVILRFMGQPEDAIIGATLYTRITLFSLGFIYLSSVLRSYLTALERGKAMLFVALLGFIANLIGNYALVYGHFGFPALGLAGSAWASVITNIAMALVVFWLCLREKHAADIKAFTGLLKPNWKIFWQLFAVGTPIAIGLISETGMFQFAMVLMGWINVSTLAAHTIVMNVASLTFMIPLGLSIATSIRVGNAMGRGDREGLIKGVGVSYVLVLAIMTTTAMSFWFFPSVFIEAFQDPNREDAKAVARIAGTLFMAAAAFQIFDGAQVVAISSLRGMQDVLIPSIIAFISYWLIGAPMAYYLAFKTSIGAVGVWYGLAIGLAAASVFLLMRFVILMRKKVFVKPS